MEDQLQKLLKEDQEFAKMAEEKGATEAFKCYLTEKSLQLPQGQKPQIGNTMAMEPGETMTWKPRGGNISKADDLGYTWGEYVFKLANGKEILGKYLNVWAKQTDGSWKVEVDMGNDSG